MPSRVELAAASLHFQALKIFRSERFICSSLVQFENLQPSRASPTATRAVLQPRSWSPGKIYLLANTLLLRKSRNLPSRGII